MRIYEPFNHHNYWPFGRSGRCLGYATSCSTSYPTGALLLCWTFLQVHDGTGFRCCRHAACVSHELRAVLARLGYFEGCTIHHGSLLRFLFGCSRLVRATNSAGHVEAVLGSGASSAGSRTMKPDSSSWGSPNEPRQPTPGACLAATGHHWPGVAARNVRHADVP